MKTSTVFIITMTCSVLFSAWLIDHSPTQALIQSAMIVAVLLVMLSLLLTYAVHLTRKHGPDLRPPILNDGNSRYRELLMLQQYPHVAEWNRRAKELHKQSTSGKVKS